MGGGRRGCRQVNAMNVLLVAHELTLTGAPHSLLRQARYLRAAGHEVRVWALSGGDLLERYVDEGFPPEMVADDLREIMGKLASESCRFDLAICNTIATYRCVEAMRRLRLPVVWFIRETHLLDEWIWLFPDFARLFRSMNCLYTVSEYAASIVGEYNPNVRIVRNSVADSFKEFTSPGANASFGFIGSIIEPKGIDLLVGAFLDVLREFPGVELHIAGETPTDDLGDRLRDATRHVQSIHWLGPVRGEAKRRFFDLVDVLCMPSLDEPCGLSLLEGAMFGKALVATDRVGANYIVDERCGRVAKAGNKDSLAAALRSFAAMDAERRAKFGVHARERYLSLGTPAMERDGVLKMLADNAHMASSPPPSSWRSWRPPFLREVRHLNGLRRFYIGKWRVFSLHGEGVRRR